MAVNWGMVSRDYTKEIGVASGEKLVSKPVAIVVLLLACAAGWFIVRSLPPADHPMEAHSVGKAQ